MVKIGKSETMRKIKLTISVLHPSLNEWINWHYRKIGRVKDDFDGEITLAMLTEYSCVRIKPLMKKARVRIKYYFRDKRKRDKDNYPPKFIMDGLKGRVIKDDSSDVINLDWELLYDKKHPRTEIEIEEME